MILVSVIDLLIKYVWEVRCVFKKVNVFFRLLIFDVFICRFVCMYIGVRLILYWDRIDFFGRVFVYINK